MSLVPHHDTKRSSPRKRTFRIAIVGGGPKGMYCLERLCDELGESQLPHSIEITVFEPSQYPGAGFVYDLDQPPYLRMNFASRHIDAWHPGNVQRDCQATPDLVQWLKQRYPPMANPDAFVPRAIVGEYLHWCYLRIVETMPNRISLHHARDHVVGVSRDGEVWRVQTSQSISPFDEVLITVGHEGWRPSPTSNAERNVTGGETTRCINSVFPVTQQLSIGRIGSEANVAIRGFGLTWIDASLALTEGRDGGFEIRNEVWSYQHSGREPRKILPFSRTGRPLLAKPDVVRMTVPTDIENVWQRGRDNLMRLPRKRSGLEFAKSIWPLLLDTASEGLRVIEGARAFRRRTAAGRLANWFREWEMQSPSPTQIQARMQQSYDVAVGCSQPDEAWALGEMWRALYPALVARISHGGLTVASWTEFRRHAAEMERIAFGPPAENLGRILALLDASLIDLGFLRSRMYRSKERLELEADGKRADVDFVVSAVLPGSDQFAAGSVVAKLVDSGVLHCMDGARGIAVDKNGRPVSKDAESVAGLAVIGRPTEGCVLGNDTLSRRLHDHPTGWAKNVVRRIARRGQVHDAR